MSLYDRARDCVANDYWCSVCPVCKRELLKKDMVTLLAKRQYTNPVTILHLCPDCFAGFCEVTKVKKRHVKALVEEYQAGN